MGEAEFPDCVAEFWRKESKEGECCFCHFFFFLSLGTGFEEG